MSSITVDAAQVVLTRKLLAERRRSRAGSSLPPGQRPLGHAPPRFGLESFLSRAVAVAVDWRLVIDGEVETPLALDLDEVIGDRRAEATHDLHCVTTWTATGLEWSGRGFHDLWESVIVPRARPQPGVAYLLATALDGYEAAVPLEEALDPRCLLADRLHGRPLPLDHGAPLRLVVPRLYANKSVKHLARLSLRVAAPSTKISRFLAHPRGRVDLEERSGVGFQRFWRVLYRLLRPVFLRQARRHQLGR